MIALLAGLVAFLAAAPTAAASRQGPAVPDGAVRMRSFEPDSARAQRPPLAIRVDAAAGFRPILDLGPVLEDPALEQAARSGFPLRLRFRVELWRDRFFDNLAGTVTWTTALLYEPLDDRFLVRSQGGAVLSSDHAGFAAARAAIERRTPLDLRPDRSGSYYYTAALEVETLSLSDLEELEQWLRGELQPAVSGKGSVPAAVGQGAKRLLIRVLGLPARRYDARTDRFRVP